jgi:hypothetical protein
MMDLWVRCYISVDTLVDSETKQDTSFVIICSFLNLMPQIFFFQYPKLPHWLNGQHVRLEW